MFDFLSGIKVFRCSVSNPACSSIGIVQSEAETFVTTIDGLFGMYSIGDTQCVAQKAKKKDRYSGIGEC